MKDLKLLHEADKKGAITEEKLKNMSLIRIINTLSNWKEVLQTAPLNITVKEDEPYILLKYNQFDSDMSFRAVRESRGPVLRLNELGKYQYVCRPFDKFFNYGEKQATQIDWNSGRITEKIDGSLMKCWYDDNKWHLSTNGTIDAFKAKVDTISISKNYSITFGKIFERALGLDIQSLGNNLDRKYTYLFELTSPETKIVIPYEDGVYYLSRIETETGKEDFSEIEFPINSQIFQPKLYHLTNLENTINIVNQMTKDEEGVVVNDKYGNRIKVKSPEYLLAAHIANNRNISDRKIIEYIKEEKVDDLTAYFPEYNERVKTIKNEIEKVGKEWEGNWNSVKHLLGNRKIFAQNAVNYNSKAFLFAKYNNPELKAADYLLSIHTDVLIKQIQNVKNNTKEKEER